MNVELQKSIQHWITWKFDCGFTETDTTQNVFNNFIFNSKARLRFLNGKQDHHHCLNNNSSIHACKITFRDSLEICNKVLPHARQLFMAAASLC